MEIEEPDAAAMVVDAGRTMSSGDNIVMKTATTIKYRLQFRWLWTLREEVRFRNVDRRQWCNTLYVPRSCRDKTKFARLNKRNDG